jgi:putative ABC transport system substrate-binding protein
MRRRDFIGAIAGAAVGRPSLALAQRASSIRRIGILFAGVEDDPEIRARVAMLRQSLHTLGWIEGRSVQLEYRVTNDSSRLRNYAAELVRLKPDVIVSSPTPATSAVKNIATQIPVVFANVANPVSSGFVASLARPGGNMTGFTNFESSLGGKWLDILREIVPGLRRVGYLYNPETAALGSAGGVYLEAARAAAARWGIELVTVPVHAKEEINSAIGRFIGTTPSGLIVNPNAFLRDHRSLIAQEAARHRVVVVYPFSFFVESGGLLSYGIDSLDMFRGAATYVDRILKGEKPSDLPVQAPTKFEMVVNLKAAKALGLTIPESFLLRADRVIE